MDLDGYLLYERMKYGDPVLLSFRGQDYKLQFQGDPIGTTNFLLLTSGTEQRRYGWGWGPEQVWRAVEHLEEGLNQPQLPRFKAYDEKAEVDR